MKQQYRKQLFVSLAIILFLTAVALSTTSLSKADTPAEPDPALEGGFVPNEILIGIRPERLQDMNDLGRESYISSLDLLNIKYDVEQVEPLFRSLKATDTLAVKHNLAGIYKLTVPPGTDLFAMISDYQKDAAVAYAEPNRIYTAFDLPTDPQFGNQWSLDNNGQTGGLADADIDASEAWEITQGNSNVLIAVVDTGVDYTHPDLDGGRVRTDIDRDFANGDEDALDDNGHGTFVSAIIAADANDGQGIAGICWNCQILPVKVLNGDGSGTAAWVAQGIQYAADSGAQIINMSLGFPSNCGCSQTVATVINYAFERGSLLIAASGNDGDKEGISYPAASPRVMAVGSSNHADQESDFSNRGPDLDIVAPGEDIYSADLGGSYRTASGTSAAAPHVSGVAGLLLSANPGMSHVELWGRLAETADPFPATAQANADTGEEGGPIIISPPTPPSPADKALDFQLFLPSLVHIPPTPQGNRTGFGRLNAHNALTMPLNGSLNPEADGCTGEPAGCVPGCGAEVILTRRTSVFEDLQLLRDFRDQVLRGTAVGEPLISLYENSRLEMALLLATNPTLRADTQALLETWFPLIEALLYPDTAAPALVTESMIAQTEAVSDQLAAAGSDALRADITAFRELIANGRDYVGLDVREAWPLWNANAE